MVEWSILGFLLWVGGHWAAVKDMMSGNATKFDLGFDSAISHIGFFLCLGAAIASIWID